MPGCNDSGKVGDELLEECLEQLAAGDASTEVLAHYGAQAEELAPLLAVVTRLQGIRTHRLSEEQRQHARAVLRAALDRPATPAPWWSPLVTWLNRPFLMPRARMAATMATLVAIICIAVTVTGVAASQPGDVGYPLRVVVERAPVLLQATAAGRAMAELNVADRRLADLEAHLHATGEVAAAAVRALLAGDQAAAARAEALPPAEREAIAARVAAHAQALASLAPTSAQLTANPLLEEAATQASELANRLARSAIQPAGQPALTATPLVPQPAGILAPSPTPVTTSPVPGEASHQPYQPVTMTPSATATGRHVEPGRRATVLAQTATPAVPADTATPTDTARPLEPGRRATALAQTATARPATATPFPTPSGPATGTPVVGRRATALAQTATAQAPTPVTTPEPGPGNTVTPAPGRRATALAQTATAQAPTPTGTPEPTREDARTPIVGWRATALAQTATAQAPTPTPDTASDQANMSTMAPPGLPSSAPPGHATPPAPGR